MLNVSTTKKNIFGSFLQFHRNNQGHLHMAAIQGCQMAHFQTENPVLGKFWRDLKWKILVYFTAIGPILRRLVCSHLVYFMIIWYIFSPFWYVVARTIWQPCSHREHWSDAPLTKELIIVFAQVPTLSNEQNNLFYLFSQGDATEIFVDGKNEFFH
jgi:hypothetical protein